MARHGARRQKCMLVFATLILAMMSLQVFHRPKQWLTVVVSSAWPTVWPSPTLTDVPTPPLEQSYSPTPPVFSQALSSPPPPPSPPISLPPASTVYASRPNASAPLAVSLPPAAAAAGTEHCQLVLGVNSCWVPTPDTPPSPCAVVLLANPAHRPLRGLNASTRTLALLKGLRLFQHNYNLKHTTARHDVLIFHEDFNACDKKRLREAASASLGTSSDEEGNRTQAIPAARIRFISYNPLALPPGAIDDVRVRRNIARWKAAPHGHDQGYSGMLRFYAGALFEHPILQEGYEYVLRLDSDAMYLQPTQEDFVARFRRNGGTYLTRGPLIMGSAIDRWELDRDLAGTLKTYVGTFVNKYNLTLNKNAARTPAARGVKGGDMDHLLDQVS